jgi:hypothetical protein
MRIIPRAAGALTMLFVASLFTPAWLSPLTPEIANARACFQPDEASLSSHRHYQSRGDGCDVHGPAESLDGTKPEGASARCRDGSWSFSHTRSGTCSRHGGVERWETGSLGPPVPGLERAS